MNAFRQSLEPDSQTPLERERSTLSIKYTEIRLKGKDVLVPSVQIEGKTAIASGKWLKIATFKDEDLLEGETVSDPQSLVLQLTGAELKADIFTFAQKLPHTVPKHRYHVEWDNLAVIPITTFSEWWEKRVDASVRRAVRKSVKTGVETKLVEFNDALVEGIVGINNETPFRQGRPFWHFQKSFDAVRRENSTYAERNAFLAAYYQGEMIGFIRLTYTNHTANIIQLLTMMKHFDKRPANALIAKAVEICEQKGVSHLVYYNYVYNDPDSSLTEFKRRNGFEKLLIPRYYIPLTVRGRAAMALGLHRGFVQSVPKPLLKRLLRVRDRWYAHKQEAVKETV